jgi:hypothetical protein
VADRQRLDRATVRVARGDVSLYECWSHTPYGRAARARPGPVVLCQ